MDLIFKHAKITSLSAKTGSNLEGVYNNYEIIVKKLDISINQLKIKINGDKRGINGVAILP